MKFTRCPVTIAKRYSYLLHAYVEYKNGFLPNEGGWLDQPMKFTESMKLIENKVSAMEKENGKQ